MVNGDDLRRQPLRYRKLALGKLLLRSSDGIQYVEHAESHGDRKAFVWDLRDCRCERVVHQAYVHEAWFEATKALAQNERVLKSRQRMLLRGQKAPALRMDKAVVLKCEDALRDGR